MHRLLAPLVALSLVACGGDSTPLPPLAVGPEWMPVMLDTTGNLMMRRMALWVDTAHVTTGASGYAQTLQRMQMDMKIGGMSTTMRMRMEVDCAGARYRTAGLDSMAASMNGTPLPDSVARQAMAQQSEKLKDTTWRTAGSDASGAGGSFVSAVCAHVATKSDSAATPRP
ncbi:MAG: hypothetical protein V4813_18520 [Gemmatimonadota bacterium]